MRYYGVSTGTLAGLNLHRRSPAKSGRSHLPSGTTAWLPAGSMRRVASHPPACSTASVMLASSERKATTSGRSLARAEPVKVNKAAARSKPKPEPKVAVHKSTKSKASRTTRCHVVKPQETLYRVALINGISVNQLRKLNRLGPNDNNIRVGQKLKVGI